MLLPKQTLRCPDCKQKQNQALAPLKNHIIKENLNNAVHTLELSFYIPVTALGNDYMTSGLCLGFAVELVVEF